MKAAVDGRAVFFMMLFALLAGCDDSQSASTANFQKALQSYYDSHPVCVSLAVTLPTSIGTGGIEPMRPQLEALAKAGVLKKSETSQSGAAQPPASVRYSVVPGNEKFVHAGHDSFLGGTDLCFTRRKIAKVEAFTKPAQVMGRKVSQVTYDFELVDVAPWAKTAAITTAFPGIKAALSESPAKETEAMVLTDKGWHLERDAR